MTAVDELIAFLRAQLDEDERVAKAVDPQRHRDLATQVLHTAESGAHLHALHIARWDPARVLAEVEAKRRILDEHSINRNSECELCRERGMDRNQAWPCLTVRLLAQPYAGQSGWREEWRA